MRANQPVFVPQVSVTFAFVLCLLSILALVVFLAQTWRSRSGSRRCCAPLHRDAGKTVREMLTRRDRAETGQPVLSPPDDAVPLLAGLSGFLVDPRNGAARRCGGRGRDPLFLHRWPGASPIAGTPIGRRVGTCRAIHADAMEPLARCIEESLTTGFEANSRARHQLWNTATHRRGD